MLVSSKQPKCGFLPLSSFIAEENNVKRSVTRFKMHQALKLLQGKVIVLHSFIFFFMPIYAQVNDLIFPYGVLEEREFSECE